MRAADAFAPAKINLTLHVTGQRADGYHLLDSLVVFADVGDRLWFYAAEEISLKVTGPFSSGVPTDDHNLVWRAVEKAGKTQRIHLEKNLPHGAGIGGGSADAAAVLRVFNVKEGAEQLGADVPVCLSNQPQRMRGVGDILDPIANMPSLELVLVNPGAHVPTPDVFRALAQKSNPPMTPIPDMKNRAALVNWLAVQRNDLEAVACSVAPVIGEALSALEGAQLARMSGSGSTCFGVFEDESTAREAATQIKAAHPHWWVVTTRSLPSR